MNKVSRFAGKVAIVTGGTSGIGKTVSIRLASLGAKVVIAGINEADGRSVEEIITKAGNTASLFGGDLTKRIH
jgi:NAD(P)-dependent dehydrogenase (short-subunit alcohol dehydrogenase family)